MQARQQARQQFRQQVRWRWARWRADARYRRRFRQQLWQRRRQRLRWEARRARNAHEARWHSRSVRWSRHVVDLRDLGSDVGMSLRERLSAGSGRIALPLTGVRRGLATAWRGLSAAAGRGTRALVHGAGRLFAAVSSRSPRPSPRLAGAVALLLFSGVGGYAVLRSLGDVAIRGPSADETARPAADHPGGGARVPGLTRPGIFVSVGVAGGGGLEVSETARTGKSVVELSITPPPPLDGVNRLPHLEDVRVTADGRRVTVPKTVEVTTVVFLDRPATVIELHYRIVDASARRQPDRPGRATLSLRPALATTLDDSRAVIEVHGTKVHTLLCVDLPAKQQPCGVERAEGWRTQRLDTDSSTVVALVDLPDRAA